MTEAALPGPDGRPAVTATDHAAPHAYISTACFHGLCDEEGACRQTCKFCDAPCGCPCHRGSSAALPEPWVDQARNIARELLRYGLSTSEAVPPELLHRIETDPALFWLRNEEQAPGEWHDPGRGDIMTGPAPAPSWSATSAPWRAFWPRTICAATSEGLNVGVLGNLDSAEVAARACDDHNAMLELAWLADRGFDVCLGTRKDPGASGLYAALEHLDLDEAADFWAATFGEALAKAREWAEGKGAA